MSCDHDAVRTAIERRGFTSPPKRALVRADGLDWPQGSIKQCCGLSIRRLVELQATPSCARRTREEVGRQDTRSKVTVRARGFGRAVLLASIHESAKRSSVASGSGVVHQSWLTCASFDSGTPARSSISPKVRTTVSAYRASRHSCSGAERPDAGDVSAFATAASVMWCFATRCRLIHFRNAARSTRGSSLASVADHRCLRCGG
jgi:hypothetical protein